MQALKSLVIGLGILVVAGMVVLVYGLVQNASDPDFAFFKPAESPAAQSRAEGTLAPFGDITLDIGAGCRVEQAWAEDARLHVRVGPAGACARIVVVDLASGRTLGNILFRGTP